MNLCIPNSLLALMDEHFVGDLMHAEQIWFRV